MLFFGRTCYMVAIKILLAECVNLEEQNSMRKRKSDIFYLLFVGKILSIMKMKTLVFAKS